MTPEKAIFITIITCICIAIIIVISFPITPSSDSGGAPAKSSSSYVPPLSSIQEAIGAVPDGIYGSETKRLWDKKIAEQIASGFYKDFEAMNKSILEGK